MVVKQKAALPRNRIFPNGHAQRELFPAAIQVDKGVPMPLDGKGKYPWDQLEVGDSFFVPDRTTVQMSSCAKSAAHRRGHEYTTRSVTENGVKGCRVWRLK